MFKGNYLLGNWNRCAIYDTLVTMKRANLPVREMMRIQLISTLFMYLFKMIYLIHNDVGNL